MKRTAFSGLCANTIAAFAFAAMSSPAGAGVFQTVTNNADAGPGSLRAAITAANATSGTVITFSIGTGCGPHVIALTTPLPDITAETHIEGYSQPGASVNDLDSGDDANVCVILDGGTGGISDGFTVPASVADATTVSVIGLGFSGFSHAAINLRGGSGHVVSGNHIGGQVNGVNLDPVGYGIVIGPGVHGATIGGDYTNYALRNIIGEALNDGIHIDGSGATTGPAHDNAIIDNYIGVGFNGQNSFARGNGANGIYVAGYKTDIERNYIEFNANHGVRLTGADAHDTTIEDNFIGYLSGRTDAGNGVGVQIDNGSSNNSIDYNSIWDNVGAGVTVLDASTGNFLFGNQYRDNGGLGIDLGGDGVTPNDNDSMAGTGLPNREQNFPMLTGAIGGHHSGTLSGTLTTTPGVYTIQAFSSPACDASGYGQGEFPSGNAQFTIPNITVQGQGSISFQLPLNGYFLPPYTAITAVAIDASGNTSEFSNCIAYVDDTIFAGNFETFQ